MLERKQNNVHTASYPVRETWNSAPALGAVVGLVKKRKAQGITAALTRPVTGQAGRLYFAQAFETLDDLEAHRRRNADDAESHAYVDKVAELESRPVDIELTESLLLAQEGAAPSYIQRIRYTAAPAQGLPLREALVEWFTARQATGFRVGLSESVASGDQQFYANALHDSLGSVGDLRGHNRDNAALKAFNDRLAPMLAGFSMELIEIVIPR